MVGVKDVKEEIEVIREFSTPSPGGMRVGLEEVSIGCAEFNTIYQGSGSTATWS